MRIIQFPSVVCGRTVIPVQDVVRVPIGAAEFRCYGQGTGVEDVLAEVEVVKTTAHLQVQVGYGRVDQLRVADGTIFRRFPLFQFANGNGVFRPAPLIEPQEVLTGFVLNVAVGIVDILVVADRVVGKGVGHGITQTARPRRIDSVVFASADRRAEEDLHFA